MNFALFLFLLFPLFVQALHIVVIGGGPVGLGAAIEAKRAGCDVIVVEKRESYTRNNTLFLHPHILDLFEEWESPIPHMQELSLRGKRRGFALIKEVEEGLSQKLLSLHIPKIQGTLIGLSQQERAAIIRSEEGDFLLPYDLLIGADGTHSEVRTSLEIPWIDLGEAIGAIAMIPSTYVDTAIAIETPSHPDIFAKKVSIPDHAVLFFQNKPHNAMKELSHEKMLQYAEELQWEIENPLFEIENIAIPLRQAAYFVDEEKQAILIGDAAASASFYQGQGVNSAFYMLPVLRTLLDEQLTSQAFYQFNQSVEQITQELIDLNLPLFNNNTE